MNKILIVDDEESIRWVLKKGLEKEGYEAHTAKNTAEALFKIKREKYFLAFFDIVISDENGLELLEKTKKIDNNLSVIIMTAQDTMKNAITAMQKGAYDYITKPFDFDEIYMLVKKVLELQGLSDKVSALEAELKDRFEAGEIVGRSKKMREVFKIIGRTAASDVSILITGESGTGKELVARAIHQNSKRVVGPFISLNCAAVPRDLMESEMFGHEKGAFTGAHECRVGKFELANGGTLFLDEIGDMNIELQAKILRALQEKEFVRVGGRDLIKFDVRIISATNHDLKSAIEEKRFRDDLYHRLNVMHIPLPPLRERHSDILALIKYFLKRSQSEMGGKAKSITQDALSILKRYEWRGNVRELENVIKRAVVLSPGNNITAEHLPDHIRETYKNSSPTDRCKEKIQEIAPLIRRLSRDNNSLYDLIIKDVEKVLISTVLQETDGNQVKTAKILGINRNTLSRKIKELL